MKKFKSILCGALAFVAGSLVLSACGAKTEQQETPAEQTETISTKTMISLAEAKKIIIHALAIEEDDGKLHTQAVDETGNRDVMEKMGKFTWKESLVNTRFETNETGKKVYEQNSEGIANYKENIALGRLDYGSFDFSERYVANNIHYDRYNGNDLSVGHLDNFGVTMVSADYFTDAAFANLYKNEVIKETVEGGYNLTFSASIKSAYLWTFKKDMSPDECDEAWLRYEEYLNTHCTQSQLDQCRFNVIVNFNSDNEIVGMMSDWGVFEDSSQYNYDFVELSEYKIIMNKTDKEIVEPEWVTEYKNSQQG